ESFIANFIEPRVVRPPRSDPKIQLADNFAPVPCEVPPQPCTLVRGEIPECLKGGIYIRNGANPLFKPVGGYHYFDGHGMLHAVKFVGGVPYYCCRYTKTNRYKHEASAGRSLFPNPLGDSHGVPGIARITLFAMRVALGIVDATGGIGTANAGLVFHNGTLLAMSEDDMPYAVRICESGDLETVGRFGFDGENQLNSPMTAHPKLDPRTGELLCYSYSVATKPYLKYFKVSARGVKSKDVPIPLSEPVMMHDFVATENFVVFPETQIVFRFQDLFLKRTSAVVCDENKVPRFGVLPRNAEDVSGLKWFDVPGFTSLHFVTGWEEDGGEKIVLIAAKTWPLRNMFDDPASVHNTVCEVHLDMKTSLATVTRVTAAVLEIGQVDHRMITRKTRYAYYSIYGPWPKFSGVAKLDLNAPRCSNVTTISEEALEYDPAVVAWRKFGTGRFGSEPFFVPRNDDAEEDDGFLLCYVHDEITGVSELLIMDASSPKLDTVASIELPSRVPYGFHGLFVNKEKLAQQ
ncbi:hypothetical protein SELMODRAFT_31991, partial [Selaginella moellendorffii]